MRIRSSLIGMLACALAAAAIGCRNAPGKPAAGSAEPRPDAVLNFATLYQQNCAACHGAEGKNGAAISLANPVYLATAGVTNIKRITAAGVPGTMMPPFAKSSGGMLTDKQISVLAQGMVSAWGNPGALGDAVPPAYASSGKGDPAQGEKAYTAYCARCHGADGSGASGANEAGSAPAARGSIVDPAYLALISDQGLRSLLIAGQPEQGMPDWRSDVQGAGAQALSDQQITDIVAWLGTHRTAAPGQPYQQHE